MSDFDDTRQLTMDMIRKHRKNDNVQKEWKDTIRTCLLEVRDELIEVIEDYT